MPPATSHAEAADPLPASTADNVASALAEAALPQPSDSQVPAASSFCPDYAGCLSHLSEHFSFSRHSVRSSVVGENAGYFSLGAMFGSGKVGLTHLTQAFRLSCIFLNQFLLSCFPGGEWTSICIARSVQTAMHSDAGNLPGSTNFSGSLGDFTGGELWLAGGGSVPMRDRFGRIKHGHTICAKHSPFSFPCDRMHATMPWQGGPRWALTAYSVPGLEIMSEEARNQLSELGFPLPGTSGAGLSNEPVNPPAAPAILPSPPALPQAPAAIFLDICSGASAPLSTELCSRGVCCLPVDTIRDSAAGDLLDDANFDKLLRVANSGMVRFAHASPPCTDFSRIKSAHDGGPKPIRSVDCPEGLPNLSESEQRRLHDSKLLLVRCVAILDAVFCAGGHVSLEQPRNALSWLTHEVQEFLKRISADLVVIPACSVGLSIHKHWLFASSWRPLQSLAASCDHKYSEHTDVRGARNSEGGWLSQRTAEFPSQLCVRFADLLRGVFDTNPEGRFISLAEALSMLQPKSHSALPRANQDGGGITSLPDWSSPPPGQKDRLQGLRSLFSDWLAARHIPVRLRSHVQSGSEDPLFTPAEVLELRSLTSTWFTSQGVPDVSWEIPEFQPYALSALQSLAKLIQDPDESLWPCLLEGVPTGIDANIPKSNVFIPVQQEKQALVEELHICQGNWKQATYQPDLLADLVEKEAKEGWIFSLPNLPSRKPRLIVDTTVSGTNTSVVIPEKYSLPGLQDVMNSLPLRGSTSELAGFSMDIRAAHKTVRVKPEEQGLLGFEAAGSLWFYRVAPFGGVLALCGFRGCRPFLSDSATSCSGCNMPSGPT